VATSKDRETRAAREARERARIYRARQEFHASLQRRSRRDNLIAGIVGGVIVLAAIGAQVAYFTAGPGTPPPAPAPTSTTTDAPTPEPSESVAPDPAASTPAPDVTP
jgi:hypothetical protein